MRKVSDGNRGLVFRTFSFIVTPYKDFVTFINLVLNKPHSVLLLFSVSVYSSEKNTDIISISILQHLLKIKLRGPGGYHSNAIYSEEDINSQSVIIIVIVIGKDDYPPSLTTKSWDLYTITAWHFCNIILLQ